MKPRSTTKTTTKRLGTEISRIIGIAQEVKRQQRQPTNGPAPLRPTHVDNHDAAWWQLQASTLANKLAKVEKQLEELRRRKLANYSLADIEAELQHRLQQQANSGDTAYNGERVWKSTGRVDRTWQGS